MNDTFVEVFESEPSTVSVADTRPPTQVETGARAAIDAVFARLQSLIDERGGIVVHVTAATEGEGTSTIARALSAAGGRAGWCRTALIDANPRAATSVIPAPGALPALLDRPSTEAALQLRREVIDGARVDIGSLLSPNSGMPSADRLRELFEMLRRTYRLTVLDCPPALTAPNATAMARLTDGVLLVVAAEQARVTVLLKARDELENLGASFLGIVFNKRRERLPRRLARWF